jgi:predicted porin
VSYSPKVRRNATAVDSRERIEVNNAIEFGLQYQQPVGDWILGASGGYATGEADPITTRADLRSWSVGAEARRGPLRIGGAYVDRGDSNRLDRGYDQWEVNGGIGWITPEWGVAGSVAYTKASIRKNRLFGVGGFYRIHPNIELRADVVQFREERVPLAIDQGIASVIEVTFTI